MSKLDKVYQKEDDVMDRLHDLFYNCRFQLYIFCYESIQNEIFTIMTYFYVKVWYIYIYIF